MAFLFGMSFLSAAELPTHNRPNSLSPLPTAAHLGTLNLHHFLSPLPTTPIHFFIMHCRGCNGIFKTESGLIRHLSNKLLCQKAMGISVPTIQPPTLSLSLNPQPLGTERKNKKRPPPPQLPYPLKPPPTAPLKKHPPSKSFCASSDKASLSHMDSHNLKSVLSGMLVDQGLMFEQWQQMAGHQTTRDNSVLSDDEDYDLADDNPFEPPYQ